MSDAPRWIEDARIKERMHAQGLGLDMMLSVDRGSDAVVLRTTTRHLTREEARELGQRLIEAALLAGERVEGGVRYEVVDVATFPASGVDIVTLCGACRCMLVNGHHCRCLHPGEPLRIRDAQGDWFERVGPGSYRFERASGEDSMVRYTLEEIYENGIPREIQYQQ